MVYVLVYKPSSPLVYDAALPCDPVTLKNRTCAGLNDLLRVSGCAYSYQLHRLQLSSEPESPSEAITSSLLSRIISDSVLVLKGGRLPKVWVPQVSFDGSDFFFLSGL